MVNTGVFVFLYNNMMFVFTTSVNKWEYLSITEQLIFMYIWVAPNKYTNSTLDILFDLVCFTVFLT